MVDEKMDKGLYIKISPELKDRIDWLAFQKKRSKSQIIRDAIEESVYTEDPDSDGLDKLEEQKKQKQTELMDLQAKIEKINLLINQTEELQPIKDEKFKCLYEDAVTQVLIAMGRNKENVVADGQARYVCSMGFKVNKQALIDEALRRKLKYRGGLYGRRIESIGPRQAGNQVPPKEG